MGDGYPPAGTRRLITAAAMAATVMNSLDATIANVALPHIQGSVSASSEEITWVLTSYIVASAITIPLTGWLAGRFGRKRLMLYSIVGFTMVSGLCGVATSLSELVIFRLLQGIFGAALVPMSQAILLDINPPERHGSAMGVWGMGAILGPIIGPALGGWLTDNFTWRWVFYINLPVGALAFAGIYAFLKETRKADSPPFDLFGFAMLALTIGSFQLMLDRGQSKDWFNSVEICIEAGAAALFGYLFVVHTLTAHRPFVDLIIFKDPNFVSGSILGFFLGTVLFGVLALLPPMLETLMGYPVVLTGLVTAPRGLGTMLSMLACGRLINRVDGRLLIGVGFAIAAYSLHVMSGFSLGMDDRLVAISGFIQGIGTGLIFVPLSTIVFATMDTRYRNEGAAMFTLIRNLGSAVGISVVQALTIRNSAAVHSRLSEGIRPDNPILDPSIFDIPAALQGLNAQVSRQAAMVANVDAFWLLSAISLGVIPLLLLMRGPRKGAQDAPVLHLD